MTVLGQAFIEVRADLKPFTRDLEKELDKTVAAFEKRLSKSIGDGLKDVETTGEQSGEKLGDGVGKGIRRQLGDKRKSPWLQITGAFASALDDGISALPTEVKAAIVFGIVAALPFLSGALAGAVSAAVGVGLAGIGAIFAFQYDEVRQRGVELASDLRLVFLDIIAPFVPAMLRAMDTVEKRFLNWAPLLNRIFTTAAKYVDPLTDGILNMLEEILNGIDAGLGNTDGFVMELSRGLRTIGDAVGDALAVLASTGQEGQEAFRDFIFLVKEFIVNLAVLLKVLTEVYGVVRDIGFIFLGPFWSNFIAGSEKAAGAGGIMVQRNHELARSTEGVIKLTDEEVKRLKELEKSLKNASDATYGVIQSQVDFERSLDNIRDTLDENGRTLDITKEKGRENVEAFLLGLKKAEDETTNQVAIGRLNAAQAATYYNEQILKVRELARQAGITGEQFNILFGDIITVAQLRLDAEAMGITNTTQELQEGVNTAAALYLQLLRIKNFRLPPQGTRPFSEYAEGGIVTNPTQALIGEAGPEVVIPLTKPGRAAQLMQQSGLAGMLSAAATLVQVFIGNEQLEGRMVQVVERNNAALGNSLAFGARGL